MRKTVFSLGVIVALALAAPAAHAATATSLSSFETIEEPRQYCTSSGCRSDSFVNITGPDATIRFYLRYNGSSWDGDQSSNRTDRQRAEVRGLGPHQNPNQTFDYSSEWRTNSSFRGTGRFTHFFQLKAYDGTMGPPMITASINNGVGSAGVKYCSGSCSSGHTTARSIGWSPATWQSLRIRVKISTSAGEVRASVNGDALSGRTGVPVYLSGSTDYQPKWGLYRGVDPGMSIGNDTMEHRNVTAERVDGTPTATPTPTPTPTPGVTPTPTPTLVPGGGGTWEAQALTYVASGASTAMQNDAAATGGTWLALLADGAGDYIQFTTPSLAAGAYTVSLRYKAHPSRGILQASVDGTNLGGTLDQYASTAGFTGRILGIVSVGAGSHTLRLTCTGRNGSAGAYTLSADTITFAGGPDVPPTPTPTPTVETPTPTPTPTATPTPTPTPTVPGGFNGFYRIVARHSAKAIVVGGGSTAEGAPVVQLTYSPGPANEWSFVAVGGGYYQVVNRFSGKVLAVQGASTASSIPVVQYTYGGSTPNDEWLVTDLGTGYYRFLNRHSGKAMDVKSGSTADNAVVQQSTPSTVNQQQFQIVSVP